MTTQTAKRLAEALYQDDMSRADEVPVGRDGHRAYDGWVRASATAGDRDTAEALEHVDRDEFAAAWDALASGGGVLTTHSYSIRTDAGSMDITAENADAAASRYSGGKHATLDALVAYYESIEGAWLMVSEDDIDLVRAGDLPR
jgi:hypothetical protein